MFLNGVYNVTTHKVPMKFKPKIEKNINKKKLYSIHQNRKITSGYLVAKSRQKTFKMSAALDKFALCTFSIIFFYF